VELKKCRIWREKD